MERLGGGLGYNIGRVFVPAFCASLLLILTMFFNPGTTAAANIAGPQASTSPSSMEVTGSSLSTPAEIAAASWSRIDFLRARPIQPRSNTGWTPQILDPVGAFSSLASGPFAPEDTDRYPMRTNGKVFFRLGEVDYECSGTVVSSSGRNVIFTAGHCVYDVETAQYVDELVFIPAYQGNAPVVAPFGIWPATAVFTSQRFVEDGLLSHDIGVIVLEDRIQNTVGARGIAFDLSPVQRQFEIYGYPAAPNPPYDGETMIGCRSQATSRDISQGIPNPIAAGPCDMRGGSSGGGWITSRGYLNSVVSYGYCEGVPSLCGLTFGPYFSDQAKNIYTYPAVGGSVSPTVAIVAGPRGRTRGSVATFRFRGAGSTPLRYRCRLDRGSYFSCGSPTRLRRLGRGSHVFRVRAIDQTGRVNSKAALSRFSLAVRRN
ncbi:MAG: trypsin-like serine protease [Solirubrobacterales bacterium]